MRNLVTSLLFVSATTGLKFGHEQQHVATAAQTSASSGYASTCDGAVRRIKAEPTSGSTSNGQFVDASFPEAEAFGWAAFQSSESTYVNHNGSKLASVQGMYGTSTFYGSEFSPEDVNQGALGDCYFLTGMGSIAERHDDFIDSWGDAGSSSLHSNGKYSYFAWPLGTPTEIVIDDKIPAYWHDGV